MHPVLAALLPLLLVSAGVAKAVADAQAHGSPRLARWLPRWAGTEAWRHKYRGGDPTAGPAFPGSTTVFVAFTDLWHLANLCAGLAIDAAVLLLAWPGPARWWAVAAVLLRRLVFQPLYSWLRK